MEENKPDLTEKEVKDAINKFYEGKDMFSQQRFEGEDYVLYRDRLKNMNRVAKKLKKGRWHHVSSYDVMKETADGKSVETVKKTYVKPKE